MRPDKAAEAIRRNRATVGTWLEDSLTTHPRPRTTLDEAVEAARHLDDAALGAAFPDAVFLVQGLAAIFEPPAPEFPTASPTDRRPELSTLLGVPPGTLTPQTQSAAVLVLPLTSAGQPTGKPLVVGRAKGSAVQLLFPSVSKVHAYVWEASPGCWQIQDAGSSNGTAVTDEEVPRDRAVPLEAGVAVIFGGVVTTFHTAESFREELRRRA